MNIINFLKKKKKKSTRRYIHKDLGVEYFFKILKDRNVNYTVLRWYETLPLVIDGEDIDLLFDDNSLEVIDDLFNGNKKNGIPCDIYSVSGLTNSDYRKMAYYPPKLNYNGKKAICKTYKPGMEIFLNREINIREELKGIDVISKLYEYGTNYIIIEYYDSDASKYLSDFNFFGKSKLYTVDTVLKIIKSVELINKKGFHLIDFHDENIIFDSKKGIKFIDFEFYYKSKKNIKNYTWKKLPKEILVDVPTGYFDSEKSIYNTTLFYRFGIPLSFISLKTPIFIIVLCRILLIPSISIFRLKFNQIFKT